MYKRAKKNKNGGSFLEKFASATKRCSALRQKNESVLRRSKKG
jgi:hypothetical protein